MPAQTEKMRTRAFFPTGSLAQKAGFTPYRGCTPCGYFVSQDSQNISQGPVKPPRGFTLIELLVVISIISLLSSVVFASVNSSRAKARDATRLAEVRQLVTVLQLYFNDNNSFPPTSGAQGGWACLGHGDAGTCWKGSYHGITALDNSLSPQYISKIPDDPLNDTAHYGDAYMYNPSYPTSAGTGAVLHWGIEKSNPTTQDCAGGDLGNWGPGNGIGSNYYCVLLVR